MTAEEFEVQGAGTLRVGRDCDDWCGTAIGFSIGVSWGGHGFAGGVMDQAEAVRLAHYILEKCPSPVEGRLEARRRSKQLD